MSDRVPPEETPRRVRLSRAALTRRRRDRLARLIPLEPPSADDTADDWELPEAQAAVLALARALASEEWRRAAGDWSFRPVRLRALRHALARARADLRRRCRKGARPADT